MKYLSPTSIQLWRKNQEDFYLKYICEDKPPRIPQTRPMSVGSAFDAEVKAYLHTLIYGIGKTRECGFDYETLFEKQVEPDNRSYAAEAGDACFEAYRVSGALSDLVLMLDGSEPRFEFTAEMTLGPAKTDLGFIGTVGSATLLGKPDAYFTKNNVDVILDWKVNGYCSKASPAPGYVMCRDGWVGEQSRSNGQSHANCQIIKRNGIPINVALPLNKAKDDWALQTTIYSWLCGSQVGSDFVVAIDQLACNAGQIRVAEHRSCIEADYQWKIYDECQSIWEIVHSDWVFRTLSRSESQERCAVLGAQAEAFRQNPQFLSIV